MGYDIFFNVNITAPTEEDHDIVRKEIAGAAGKDPLNIDGGFVAQWYDYDKDLAAISASHPGVLIEAYGYGENTCDLWAARYRDGKSETIRFEGPPAFKETLTPEEEEKIFAKAQAAYIEAFFTMREAAKRRIRTLKDRITEGPDRHLSLDRLNNVCPQLVIACERPCSNREYDPLLVYGIHDDAETLSTEQDPVDVEDLLPDDLSDLVILLEGIVKEIEKGDIKGTWNEEEGWYELYYAGQNPQKTQHHENT